MQKLQGQLPTTPQQANIDLDFSLGKSLAVHVGFTLSEQDDTSSMSAKGLTNIGIQEETQSAILLCFLNPIWRYSRFKTSITF